MAILAQEELERVDVHGVVVAPRGGLLVVVVLVDEVVDSSDMQRPVEEHVEEVVDYEEEAEGEGDGEEGVRGEGGGGEGDVGRAVHVAVEEVREGGDLELVERDEE